MTERLTEKQVTAAFLGTYAAYALFVTLTDLESFGLTSSREEEWTLARYLIVAGWFVVAYFLFRLRNGVAYMRSVRYAAVPAVALSLFLGLSGLSLFGPALFGTAAATAAVATLMCLTIKNRWLASALSVLGVLLQVVVDAFVLFVAGNFSIH